MGYAETMLTWSNINCGLSSLLTYGQMRQNGFSPYYSTMSLFGNLANGVTRNEIAYGMQKMGNPVGNVVNMYAGYGNPVSNAIGTVGIMSACTPWMYFGCLPFCGYSMSYGGFYC